MGSQSFCIAEQPTSEWVLFCSQLPNKYIGFNFVLVDRLICYSSEVYVIEYTMRFIFCNYFVHMILLPVLNYALYVLLFQLRNI